jgi:hypothetical protein
VGDDTARDDFHGPGEQARDDTPQDEVHGSSLSRAAT